jgi:hypothetical protein
MIFVKELAKVFNRQLNARVFSRATASGFLYHTGYVKEVIFLMNYCEIVTKFKFVSPILTTKII